MAKVIATIGELSIDWLETDKAHILLVDAPGLHSDDLSVQLLPGNVLQISGVHGDVEAEHGGVAHVLERPRGSFLRQFQLSGEGSLLVHRITAVDDAGVVTITIPKRLPIIRNIPILFSKL